MTRRLAAPRRAPVLALIAALLALVAPVAPASAGARAPAIATSAAAAAAMKADPAPAQGDPLESADCRRALATLNAQEAAVAATPRASAAGDAGGRHVVDARLAASRRQAAAACLARRADPPTAPPLVRPPPIAVAPLAVAPTSAPTPAAPTARAAPADRVARPVDKPYAITSCDAGGCWANDGSRLNRIGPNLWGPHGICTVQGTLVQCP